MRSLVIMRTVRATDGPPAEVPDSRKSSTFRRPCGPEAGARRELFPVVWGKLPDQDGFASLNFSTR